LTDVTGLFNAEPLINYKVTSNLLNWTWVEKYALLWSMIFFFQTYSCSFIIHLIDCDVYLFQI